MNENASLGVRWQNLVLLGATAVLLGSALVALLGELGLLAVLGLAACLATGSLLLYKPEVGVLAFVVCLYANVPVNLGHFVGSPALLGILTLALIAIPVVLRVCVQKERWVVDTTFLLMVVFLAVCLASALFSRHPETSISWISTFVLEGLLIYFLVINAIRHWGTMRRVIWALFAVATVVCLLSTFQELTGSYEQDFHGFARRNIERGLGDPVEGDEGLLRSRTRLHSVYRAKGPIGDANRFGQMLIVLVPLAFILTWNAPSRGQRLLAALVSCALLAGIFLTYSRGTLLMVVVLVFLMALLRCFPIRYLIAGSVAVTILAAVVAPGTVKRIQSIRGIESLVSDEGPVNADGAMRGRMTEMLAAFHAFRDHPALGLGPGNYMPHYSVAYMSDPEIAYRTLTHQRRAHTLYFELAAEMGILGVVAFMAIPGWVGFRLWQLRKHWLRRNPEVALLATALLLALVGYFGTAVFLHLSYQRYYWFLVALCGAAVQVLDEKKGGLHAPGPDLSSHRSTDR